MEKLENTTTKTTNWDLSFYKINPITVPDPYGFNISIVEVITYITSRDLK